LRYHSFRILSRVVTCFSVSLEELVPELVVGKDRTAYITLMIELRIPARGGKMSTKSREKTRHTELDKLVET